MRQYFLITLLIIIGAPSYAQTAAKSTGLLSRMIAKSYYLYAPASGQYAFKDSNEYSYSNGRGGDPNNGPFFDQRIGYTTFKSKIYLSLRETHLYTPQNVANEIVFEKYDTVNNVWKNNSRSYIVLNSSNLRTSDTGYFWDDVLGIWSLIAAGSYAYDGQGRITVGVYFNYNGTTKHFDSSGKYLYTYDANGNLVQYDVMGWNNGAFENSRRNIYTYDAANHRTSEELLLWGSLSQVWQHSRYYAYQLDANGNHIAQYNSLWNNTLSKWDTVTREVYALDASFNTVEDLTQNYNLSTNIWTNSKKKNTVYNSFNQPVNNITTTWSPGGYWQPTGTDYNESFYYETYTGIPKMTRNNVQPGKLDLWPVPCKDLLNATITWIQPQNYDVIITDDLGRIVMTKHRETQQAFTEQINTRDLPSGSYHISFLGGDGGLVTASFLK